MHVFSAPRLFSIVFAASLLAGCAQESASATDPMPTDPRANPSSSAGLPAGRIAEGERLANVKSKATGQSCLDCHGADGNAPIDPTYPMIGGQYGDYLGHAIVMYRDSTREHALMGQQAIELTDQQISDLAAYFSSRPRQLSDLSDHR